MCRRQHHQVFLQHRAEAVLHLDQRGTVRGRSFAQEDGIRLQPLACHIDIAGELGLGLCQRRRATQMSGAHECRFLLDDARHLLDERGQIGERPFRFG